jgi:cobalamin biosynthesis Mg chelatase CobN
VVPVEVIVVLELAAVVVVVGATETVVDGAVALADVLGTAGVQPGRVKVPS